MEAAFAVGASAPVLLISTFGDSIGQGTNSIMSRYIGSGIMKVPIILLCMELVLFII